MIYSLTAGPSMSKKLTTGCLEAVQAAHERNLINVAVTRARSKLYIIGINFILSKSGLLTELINWTYFCNRKSELQLWAALTHYFYYSLAEYTYSGPI